MLLGVLVTGVTVIVLAMVLGPLLRPAKAPPTRAAFDRAVYRDQLKELDRDVARGVLGPEEIATSRLELQRRLLAADAAAMPTQTGSSQPVLAVTLSILVVVVAGGLYWHMGSPNLPDDPYASRGAQIAKAREVQAQMAQIQAMVTKLATEMKSRPDDLDGWLRLGRSYAVLGDKYKAEAAFAKAEHLRPNDPGVLLSEAEALMVGHPLDQPMPPDVVALLTRIRGIDPKQPAMLWYLGIHEAQQGKFAAARADWQKLLTTLPAGSKDRQTVATAIEEIKGK